MTHDPVLNLSALNGQLREKKYVIWTKMMTHILPATLPLLPLPLPLPAPALIPEKDPGTLLESLSILWSFTVFMNAPIPELVAPPALPPHIMRFT